MSIMAARRNHNSRFTIRVAISLFVTILLVVLLIWIVDVRQLVQVVLNIDLSYLLMGALLYVTDIVLLATRLRVLTISRETKLSRMFFIVSAHSLINQILPLRSGEFSYMYLAKKGQSIEPQEGLASLVFVRFFDLLTVCFFFAIALVPLVATRSIQLSSSVLAGLLLLVVLLIFVPWLLTQYGVAMTRFVEIKFIRGDNSTPSKLLAKLLGFARQVMETFRTYGTFRMILPVGLLSIGVWACNFGMSIVVVHGLGYQMSVWVILLAAVVSAFSAVLPINSIGSWGTMELGWSGALIFQGISVEEAIASGVAMHLILFFYAVVLGSMGLLYVNRMSANDADRQKHS